MINIFRPSGLALVALLASGITASAVFAQSASDRRETGVTIYRDTYYRGSAVFVGSEKSNLGLAWPVKSVRVYSGSWEFCERPNFGGECRTFTRDTAILGSTAIGMTFQSIRPTGGSLIGVEAKNQVLRGKFAEFHTQPDSRGYRIPACPTGRPSSSCTKRTADAYCRTSGWAHSVSSESETIGRRQYLADVLCENSKG